VLSELLGDLGVSQRGQPDARLHGRQAQLPQQPGSAASQQSSASAAQTSRHCMPQPAAPLIAPHPQPAAALLAMPSRTAQPEIAQDAMSVVGHQRTEGASAAPTVSASPQAATQCSPTSGCIAPQRHIQQRPEQREQSPAAQQHHRADQQAEWSPMAGAGGMTESGSSADYRDAAAQQADAHLRCPLTQV